VFQSRYQSILIEEGRPLLGLVDYIHLNPVRAGLLALPDLGHHTFSSYPKFFRKHPTDGLCRARFLASLEFPDSVRAGSRAESISFDHHFLSPFCSRPPSWHGF
jgi:hypothetical protein